MADLVAGITVGFVALPLAMAFAIASGVPPQAGLYCAIVAGFVVSALGGSSTQIAGPTGAFVVVVFGIVAKYGVDGLFMCTLMAGVLLLILGVTGLGTAVKFIPRPVVVGFTNGIAVIIASTQIKDFFGLTIDKVPGEFLPRVIALAQNFSSFSPVETALGVGAPGDHRLCTLCEESSRLHRGLVSGDCGGCHLKFQWKRSAPVWRHPVGTANSEDSAISHGPAAASAVAGHHGRHAGSHRIADVRGGGGSHERR